MTKKLLFIYFVTLAGVAALHAAPRTVGSPVKSVAENVPWTGNTGILAPSGNYSVFGGTVPFDSGTQIATVTVTGTLAVNGSFITGGGGGSAAQRPVLEFVSVSTVVVQNNTTTANQTTITFPDGDIRTVTEAAGTVNQFRRFDIARTATFTACGANAERTGLLTGLSETANSWYLVYGVKSQCTSGAANFTLVGTTWPMTQSNRDILDTTFQDDGYIYLGAVRNGNGSANNSDIPSFIQSGSETIFNNQALIIGSNSSGILLSSGTGTPITYTYASGVTGNQLPASFKNISYFITYSNANGTIFGTDAAGTFFVYEGAGVSGLTQLKVPDMVPNTGIRVGNSVGSLPTGIALSNFVDSGLSPIVSAP